MSNGPLVLLLCWSFKGSPLVRHFGLWVWGVGRLFNSDSTSASYGRMLTQGTPTGKHSARTPQG